MSLFTENREIKLFTTEIIDTNKYEIIGMVSGMQVKAISTLRNVLSDVASIFGTSKKDWTGMKQKFEETQQEAIYDMISNGLKINAEQIIGVKIIITEIGSGSGDNGMIVCNATGTAIKLKTNSTEQSSKKSSKKSSNKSSKKSSNKKEGGGNNRTNNKQNKQKVNSKR